VFPETSYFEPAARDEVSGAATVVLGPGASARPQTILQYITETCILVRYLETEPVIEDWSGGRRVMNVSLRELEAEGRAEMALTLILALKRKLIRHNQQMLEGKWIAHMASEAVGTTVGIVGSGPEGTILAGYLTGLGCRVIGCRDHGTQEAGGDMDKNIREIFEESDIVSLHMTGLSRYKGAVGSEYIGFMKPHAVLIDTGCPLAVNTGALYAALKARQIEAAALDCFDREEIPADSPLLALHNLIVTPHISGKTRETLWKIDKHMIDMLREEIG